MFVGIVIRRFAIGKQKKSLSKSVLSRPSSFFSEPVLDVFWSGLECAGESHGIIRSPFIARHFELQTFLVWNVNPLPSLKRANTWGSTLLQLLAYFRLPTDSRFYHWGLKLNLHAYAITSWTTYPSRCVWAQSWCIQLLSPSASPNMSQAWGRDWDSQACHGTSRLGVGNCKHLWYFKNT